MWEVLLCQFCYFFARYFMFLMDILWVEQVLLGNSMESPGILE
jgi:hypothetical protein